MGQLGSTKSEVQQKSVSPQWPGTDGSVTIFSYLREGDVFFVATHPAGCGAGSCRANPPILDLWLF